jgi:hypothetical protein
VLAGEVIGFANVVLQIEQLGADLEICIFSGLTEQSAG